MQKKTRALKLSGLAAIAAATAPLAWTQTTDTWTGNSSPNWNDGGNWSPGLPGSPDTAYFNSSTPNMLIALNGSNQTVGTIQFDTSSVGPYTIGLTPGDGTLFINNTGSIGLSGSGTPVTGITPGSSGAISVVDTVTSAQTINSNLTFTAVGTNTSYITNAGIVTGSSTTSSASLILNGTITISGGAGAGTLNIENMAPTNVNSSSVTQINGTIVDGTGGAGILRLIGYKNGTGSVLLTGQNTYSGGTVAQFNQTTVIQLGSSSIMSGTAVVSGPLGTGPLGFPNSVNGASSNVPIQAYGGDRTLGNAIDLNFGGLTLQDTPSTGYNADPTGPHNLTLAGSINFGDTQNRNINTGMTNTTAFNGTVSGNVLTIGLPGSNASTITLNADPQYPNGSTSTKSVTLQFSPVGAGIGLVIINDVIQDGPVKAAGPAAFVDTVAYTGSGSNGHSIFRFNSLSTYNGNGTAGGGTVLSAGGNTRYQFGVSTVMNGTNITGPFGNSTVIPNNSNFPGVFEPYGGDRTIANPILLTTGLFVDNASTYSDIGGDATGAHNLTLSGPITLGTTGRIITNNMVSGVALNLGDPVSLSTVSIGSQLGFQSQTGSGGVTVINDQINNNGAAGSILAQSSAVVVLNNPNNSYTGPTTINTGALVSVSSDGNLGAGGAVNIGSGTLLSTGSFTTVRTINLTDTTTSTLDATSGNTLVLNGNLTVAGAINKGTNAGTVQLAQPSPSLPSDVNVKGGTLAFGDPVNGVTGPVNIPGTLNVSDGALATFIPATGTAITHTITNLNLNTAGKLDVGNSSFLTNSNVQPYLAAGYNNGAWNGSGAAIISTSANTAPGTAARSLGFASSADQAAGRVSNTVPTIASGSTLVKYTTPGDADLSGKSDFNDFLAMQNNFNKAGNWTQGDFDYNGTTNFNDFLILQNNFNRGLNANGTTAGGTVAGGAHAAVSKLTASSPAAVTPSVTYILSKNDDGKGNLTPGKYAVYAVDSSADGNQGVASFSVDVQGASLVTNFAPQGTFDKGQGNGSTVVEGFTLLRSVSGAFSTGTDPVKGSQDTVDDQSGVVLIYGMGQVAGNLNTKAPSGSTGGSGKVQASYGSPLLISTGTFASGLAFNSDQTFDKANVFLTNTAADTEAAGISLVTQDLSVGVPEPTTLGVIALGAGSLLGRRKRRNYHSVALVIA